MPPRISGGGDIPLPQQQALPHSEEAERAVLGGCMLDGEGIHAVRGVLSARDFYSERHKLIYEAMLSLVDDGAGIDLRTLQARLEQRGHFELVGGLAYLSGLDLDLPDVGRIQVYAEIVKERATRRRLIALSGRVIRDCMDGGLSAGEAAEKLLAGATAEVRGQLQGPGFLGGADVLDAFLERIESGPRDITGSQTGIPAVDRIIRAMKRGTLWLYCARQGVGKTALLCQMVAHDVFERRVKVGVLSLEMSSEELMIRICAQRLQIDSIRVEEGKLKRDEWTEVIRLSRELRNAKALFIDDTGSPTFEQVAAKTRMLVREHGVEAIYGDYLRLIELPPGPDTTSEKVNAVAVGLANLAKEKDVNVAMVWMHQITRSAAKENRAPGLHDLDQAGEKPAYGVVMLHRWVEDDVLSNRGLITVAKHKGGPIGKVDCYYDAPHLRWWSEEDWEAESTRRVRDKEQSRFS